MALTNQSPIVLIFLKILKNKVLILLTSTDIYSEYSSARTKCHKSLLLPCFGKHIRDNFLLFLSAFSEASMHKPKRFRNANLKYCLIMQ